MNYVLGLDLGSASLGWAIIECQKSNKTLEPTRIVRTGVRIFEAGVEGDIEQGRESSRASVRREARQPRRQNWRTQRRKRKLFVLLQRHGLLPQSESDNAAHRMKLFEKLDKELLEKHVRHDDHQAHQQLPYLLRSMAVQKVLSPHELGRAIYSLAQRRGFLSNRKTDTDEKEDGLVKAALSDLANQMGDRTIAQTFVEDVDPDNPDPAQQRIRRRYTARQMFHDEFRRIRAKQQPHFELSDDAWNEIHKTIFFQRPLKSQRHRIGRCEIDGGQRCLDALDVFQQFRIWNSVQNLRISDAWQLERDSRLSLEEQQKIVNALQTQASMTWSKVLKLLGFKRGTKFTIQDWNSRGLDGHRTNSAMINVFGDQWLHKTPEQRKAITKEVVYFRKPDALRKRGQQVWNLDYEQAALLPSVRLEEGHARHSAEMLEVFVRRMSQGENYSTIRKDLTGKDDSQPLDLLPPVNKSGLDINNPAVIRGLTELRKVVNELIREHGKPTSIRIEMARSLKNSRDRRVKLHRDNEDRRKRRERAIEGILKEMPNQKYSGADIEKWLLAEECNWHCPYTGRSISPSTLLGNQPQFDVEHIWPRRYLDNSFTNKTLCDVGFNRETKGNQTAFDACSERSDWGEILTRVSNFQGPVARLKKQRFLTGASEIPDDFTSKHLNDTRYNAVAAKKYLGMLYGGLSDDDGQKVFAVTGGHTAALRHHWHLNSVLGEGDQKSREDHRHHAIDAIVIALTDPTRIKALVDAAKLSEKNNSHRFYEAIRDPWNGFLGNVTESIHEIMVSHRPTRTLSGALHAESLYSKSHMDANGRSGHRIRKHITKLSATELKKNKIVDPRIRKLVNEKLSQLGEPKPEKAFADEANHPCLQTKDGRRIRIHKVRVFVDKKPRSIGKGVRSRYVASGKDSNFASMIYAVVDADGNEIKWEHKVITRLEAHERKSRNQKLAGEKILIPETHEFNDEKQRQFKFALCKNDTLMLQGANGTNEIYRVQSISQNEIQLCPLEWQIMPKDKRGTDNRICAIDALRHRNPRLITISPSGKLKLLASTC